MRCLLINEVESANIGDQAIAAALAGVVKSLGHTVVQADYSSGKRVADSDIGSRMPARRRKRLGTIVPRSVQTLRWFLRSLPAIRETTRQGCNLAVIGGGQLILSNAHFVPALAVWAFFLRKNRVPYAILGCGTGSTFKGWEKRLLRWVARHARGGVHLRDEVSRDRFSQITGVPCGLVPDMAFMLSEERRPDAGNSERSCRIGLSVIDYDVYRRYCPELGKVPLSESGYLEEWFRTAEQLTASGAALTLVGTAPGDAAQTEKLREMLRRSAIASTDVLRPKSWREYCDIVEDCSCVVSGRMHGLILARIVGVPVQPYIVSRKLETFASEYLDVPAEELGMRARQTVVHVIEAMRSP